MGRIPPYFFSGASRLPPKRFRMTCGKKLPSRRMFTKKMRAVSTCGPVSLLFPKSRRGWGLNPSEPPVETAGNDLIALRISLSDTCSAVKPFTTVGGLRSIEAAGCLADSLGKVLLEFSAVCLPSEQMILFWLRLWCLFIYLFIFEHQVTVLYINIDRILY